MTMETNPPLSEPWEREILADHRWGRDAKRAAAEHARLKNLFRAAPPLDPVAGKILDSILALEICFWNLEEAILALCGVIGRHEPPVLPIGHGCVFDEDRLNTIWTYYFTCRQWLAGDAPSTFEVMLKHSDPGGHLRAHILSLLGPPTELKQLYVRRFCLCLECWLGDLRGRPSVGTQLHAAAVEILDREIRERDANPEMLQAFQHEGDGKICLCHHKLFRRYDIILSSIGAGAWRAAMPERGTDGLERAATLEKFLAPIEMWIDPLTAMSDDKPADLADQIHLRLGVRDDTKTFLAALLVSLLRAQQLAAIRLADARTREKKPNAEEDMAL